LNKYKLKNVPVNDGQLKVTATEFRPSAMPVQPVVQEQAPAPEPPKPVDEVAEKLKKFGQNSEDIAEVKDVLQKLAENAKSRGAGAINMDLFRLFGGLNLCKTAGHNVEDLSHCINVHVVKRTVVDEQKGKNTNSSRNAPKGRGSRHNEENEGFNKGTAKQYYGRG
jgi:hypothetical protein